MLHCDDQRQEVRHRETKARVAAALSAARITSPAKLRRRDSPDFVLNAGSVHHSLSDRDSGGCVT